MRFRPPKGIGKVLHKQGQMTYSEQEQTAGHLANVIEWVKRQGIVNVYCVREIREALSHLAKIGGAKDWAEVDTAKLSSIVNKTNERAV